MAWTANATQSSSGVKQTATATPEATEEAGRIGADAPRASERATENTLKLCYIRINPLLPIRVLIKSASAATVPAMPDASGVQWRSGEVRLRPARYITPPPPPTSCHRSCPVLMRIRRVGDLASLGARSQRQHNDEGGKPSVPVHRFFRATQSAVPNPRQRQV